MKPLFLTLFVVAALVSPVAFSAPGFPLTPEQFAKGLEVAASSGLFTDVSHPSCDVDHEDGTYFCSLVIDHQVVVLVRSPAASAGLDSLAVTSGPKGMLKASYVLSLAIAGAEAGHGFQPSPAFFTSLSSNLSAKMELVYVQGGIDIFESPHAKTVFLHIPDPEGVMGRMRVVD